MEVSSSSTLSIVLYVMRVLYLSVSSLDVSLFLLLLSTIFLVSFSSMDISLPSIAPITAPVVDDACSKHGVEENGNEGKLRLAVLVVVLLGTPPPPHLKLMSIKRGFLLDSILYSLRSCFLERFPLKNCGSCHVVANATPCKRKAL
jgi:hypothetical protein